MNRSTPLAHLTRMPHFSRHWVTSHSCISSQFTPFQRCCCKMFEMWGWEADYRQGCSSILLELLWMGTFVIWHLLSIRTL